MLSDSGDFVALIELFSVFLLSEFSSPPHCIVVVMTKPILVFSTETVGANTFSSAAADVRLLPQRAQQFNTRWNSKAKVSFSWVLCLLAYIFQRGNFANLHTCSMTLVTLHHLCSLPPSSRSCTKTNEHVCLALNFVHHLESMHHRRRFPRV